MNNLIILSALIIWKHRNACVFEEASPSINMICSELKDEHGLWCMAAAKKLQRLGMLLAA